MNVSTSIKGTNWIRIYSETQVNKNKIKELDLLNSVEDYYCKVIIQCSQADWECQAVYDNRVTLHHSPYHGNNGASWYIHDIYVGGQH